MKYKLILAWTVLLLWLGGTVFAFYYFFASHYGVFDPSGKWQLPTETQIRFSQFSKDPGNEATWQAVFVSDPSCSCSRFARSHLKRLQEQYPTLVASELSVKQAEAVFPIQAFPLILLFKGQKLIYAGPLASDLMCSDRKSFLGGVLEGEVTWPGLWMNGESTACRCFE